MINKAAEILKNADNIMIITHCRPDGDTMGSAFALCEALSFFGKKAEVVCDSTITPRYQYFCPGKDTLSPSFEPDFIVAVDVATKKLMGESIMPYSENVDLVIDHHPTNEGYGKLNIIESDSASTGEIIYKVIKAMGCPISKTIANYIYVAVATDTGCFRYQNTTPNSLRTAAEMYEFDADTENINRRFFETTTKSGIEMKKLVYENIHFYLNGLIAVLPVTFEMISKSNAADDDVEGLAGFTRRIEGVEIGITIRQIGEYEYKISARSNQDFDVSVLCAKFGGGGHIRAAGCTLKGTLSEVEKMIVDAAKEEIEG